MHILSLQLDFTISILPKIQKKEDESTLPINNASNWIPIHFLTFAPHKLDLLYVLNFYNYSWVWLQKLGLRNLKFWYVSIFLDIFSNEFV